MINARSLLKRFVSEAFDWTLRRLESKCPYWRGCAGYCQANRTCSRDGGHFHRDRITCEFAPSTREMFTGERKMV